MKALLLPVSAACALFVTSLVGVASPSDVVFTATRKKLNENKTRETTESSHSKEIAYSVKVLNKGFRAYENVTIKYNIYYETPLLGSDGDAEVRTSGGQQAFSILPPNKPLEFETTPITLTSESLNADFAFRDGSKREVKDRVVGVWFKAFDADGKLIGEYFNPSTVPRKYNWKG